MEAWKKKWMDAAARPPVDDSAIEKRKKDLGISSSLTKKHLQTLSWTLGLTLGSMTEYTQGREKKTIRGWLACVLLHTNQSTNQPNNQGQCPKK
jgi:hypothetical protein